MSSGQLVDDPGEERCRTFCSRSARDVHARRAGGLARLRVGGVEAAGDEMGTRPALHLDRLACMMGEHEHRRGTAARDPHQPRQSSSHSSRTGPNMLRPMT